MLMSLAAAMWLAVPLQTAAFELLRQSGRTCSADPNLLWSPARVVVDTGNLAAVDRTLAQEAVSEWQSILGSRLNFSNGNGGVCDLDDGVTTIAFTETDCQGAPFGPDTLAITVTSWVGNRITDADVSFNPSRRLSAAAFRQVSMHEIGHVIGLDHSDACGASGRGTLMNSRLVESFTSPQADDIDGAFFIYGGGGSDVGVPDGANGCAVVEPDEAGFWPFISVLLVIGAVRRVRSPRRCRAVD